MKTCGSIKGSYLPKITQSKRGDGSRAQAILLPGCVTHKCSQKEEKAETCVLIKFISLFSSFLLAATFKISSQALQKALLHGTSLPDECWKFDFSWSSVEYSRNETGRIVLPFSYPSPLKNLFFRKRMYFSLIKR